MIPIVSAGNFLSFLVFLGVTILTYFSYRRRKIQFTFYFLRAFVLISFFFFIISLPGLIVKDSLAVAIVFFAMQVWLYLIIAAFIVVPLRALRLEKLEKIILLLILGLLIFTIIFGLATFKPAHFVVEGDFLYWISGINPIIRILSGLVIILGGLLFIFAFLIAGIKSGNQVLIRSIILAGAMLALVSASAVNYLAGAVPSPQTLILASILASISAFLFLAGVIYKVKE